MLLGLEKKHILGHLDNICVHGPQSSTSYSFLNGIDITWRAFCSWFSPSVCFLLRNIKAGESENKDLKMCNWGVEWSEFSAEKMREEQTKLFQVNFLTPPYRETRLNSRTKHGVAPSFISIPYRHFVQPGTYEAQEQAERTICSGTVLILRAGRRDRGSKWVRILRFQGFFWLAGFC